MKEARKHKYGVVPKEQRTVDGIVFASKREANRYGELKLLQKAKVIKDLHRQPKFVIEIRGKKVCTYIADFSYVDCKLNKGVVEDAKGMRTPVYKLKKKLVEAYFGLEIKEV
jgi:hypothetical protein